MVQAVGQGTGEVVSGGVHVEAERWIRPLPVGRGPGLLDALAKDVLRELWGHVRWEIHRDPERSERPWVSRAEIAAAIGANEHAVAKQVRKLTQMGWLKWDGRRWALAWAKPWETLQGSPDPVVPGPCSPDDRTLQSEAEDPARFDSEPCTVPKQGTHELTQEPSQVADAPAPPELVQDPPHQDIATPEPDRPGRAFDPERIADAREQLERNGLRMLDDWPHEPQPDAEPSQPQPATLAAVSPPAKPKRKRKASPPKPGQTALGLADGPPPDEVAELLELHERLRADALRAHGEAVTGWPGSSSKSGQALRRGLRQALAQRGAEWCRAMLAWRSLEWQRDATQLAWSGHNVWSGPSIQNAIERMGRATSRSRSAGLLSAPPPSYDSAVHDYVPPDCGEEMKGF